MNLENRNRLFKKIAIAIIGTIVLGMGIGMNVKVAAGGDALNALYAGLAKLTGLSLGTITMLFNVLIFILAYLINKKYLGITSIVFMLVSKWPVDFGESLMITSSNLIIKYLLCIFTLLVIALGAELLILSDLGAPAYEALTMALGKKFNMPYVKIRWICDGIIFVIDVIIKGDIGVGTIIALISTGSFMKMFDRMLEPSIKKMIE